MLTLSPKIVIGTKEYPLSNVKTSIGRSPENEIVIDHENISNFHAEIKAVGNVFTIRDLNSTNGTQLNNSPVKEAMLQPGDELELGQVRLSFQQATRPVQGLEIAKPTLKTSQRKIGKPLVLLGCGCGTLLVMAIAVLIMFKTVVGSWYEKKDKEIVLHEPTFIAAGCIKKVQESTATGSSIEAFKRAGNFLSDYKSSKDYSALPQDLREAFDQFNDEFDKMQVAVALLGASDSSLASVLSSASQGDSAVAYNLIDGALNQRWEGVRHAFENLQTVTHRYEQ